MNTPNKITSTHKKALEAYERSQNQLLDLINFKKRVEQLSIVDGRLFLYNFPEPSFRSPNGGDSARSVAFNEFLAIHLCIHAPSMIDQAIERAETNLRLASLDLEAFGYALIQTVAEAKQAQVSNPAA